MSLVSVVIGWPVGRAGVVMFLKNGNLSLVGQKLFLNYVL